MHNPYATNPHNGSQSCGCQMEWAYEDGYQDGQPVLPISSLSLKERLNYACKLLEYGLDGILLE